MAEIGQFLPNSFEREDCPLCVREPINQVLWDDEHFWVTYCATHPDCPLIVLKEHRTEFLEDEIAWIRDYVAREFPGWQVRWQRYSYPDHAYVHLEWPR